LIAGPTASGKSALAVEMARAQGGIVVNTDAMQVYDVLRVVTARPTEADMQGVPHLLFGTVPPAIRYSTGAWLRSVEDILATHEGPFVFVGGTGLYFDALTKGFAEIPEVPAAVVAEIEAELAGLDAAARHQLIAARDPATAALLQAPDPQRVARALAVLKATGRSLASYQQQKQQGLLEGFALERLVLDPGREVLRERIARRFTAMFEGGAVAEVEALRALQLDPSLPAMKAIGVPEISAYIDGELSRDEAMARAVIATRQYAKRQRTWLRNRLGDWPRAAAGPAARA
jgi:tRNA dimethylallyltransferase